MAETITPELLDSLDEAGCMYHRDNLDACDKGNSEAYYRVEGDLWCQGALDAFRAECSLRSVDVQPVAPSTKTGSAADRVGFCGVDPAWVLANVGLD